MRERNAAGLLLALLTAAAFCGLARSGMAQESALPPGFVRLRDVAPTVLQDMRYAGTFNFTGARVPGYEAAACILWAPAAKALLRAQRALDAEGLRLKVYDCYRPVRAVRAFVAWARLPETGGMKEIFYPRIPKTQLFQLGYIASQSRHSLGATVDIGLDRADAPVAVKPGAAGACDGPSRAVESALDFGTAFDCFSELSTTLHPAIRGEARANRMKLLNVLRANGFQNYAREWWHFEFRGQNAPARPLDFPVR